MGLRSPAMTDPTKRISTAVSGVTFSTRRSSLGFDAYHRGVISSGVFGVGYSEGSISRFWTTPANAVHCPTADLVHALCQWKRLVVTESPRRVYSLSSLAPPRGMPNASLMPTGWRENGLPLIL